MVSKATVGRVALSASEEHIETNMAVVILRLWFPWPGTPRVPALGAGRTGDAAAVVEYRETVYRDPPPLNHQKMLQFHRYDMASEIIEAVKDL